MVHLKIVIFRGAIKQKHKTARKQVAEGQLKKSEYASKIKKMKKRRVIGLDPGLAHTGFGIVDFFAGKMQLVSYGVIETSANDSHEVRLLALYERLEAVLREFEPDEGEMETLYFAKNISSAMAVAEAKGVATLALAKRGIPLSYYTPNQIKSAVTGTQSSDKKTVQMYVKLLLNLKEAPSPDHAADALAGAITHLHAGGSL